MKKSELTAFIKEEILSALEEATIETSPEDLAKVKQTADKDDVIKVTEEAGLNEAREYDADAMEALGFDLYPGGRNEAFKYATEELGVPADEILGKISDDVIYNAIHHSLQVMDMYPIEEKVNEEEEDAPAGDAEIEKKASKQDQIINNYKRLQKDLKKHLEMYKDAEGDSAKKAALQMMKKISQSAEYLDAKAKYEKLKQVK